MNKLGETGLRTAASKKKMREDKKAQDNEIKELEAQVAALAAERDVLAANGSSTKEIDAKMDIAKERLEAAEKTPADKTPARKGAKAETEEKKPVKRKRVSKAKKEADTDDEEEVMPAKKSRAKKVKKEEADEEEEVIPAKKPRGKQVKKEEDEPAAAVSAAKKRAGKKQVTKEEADVSEPEQKPEVKKAPSKRGRANKAAVKEESDAAEAKEQQDFKKAPSKRVRGKKAVKEEAVEDAGVAAAVPPKEESVEEADICHSWTEQLMRNKPSVRKRNQERHLQRRERKREAERLLSKVSSSDGHPGHQATCVYLPHLWRRSLVSTRYLSDLVLYGTIFSHSYTYSRTLFCPRQLAYLLLTIPSRRHICFMLRFTFTRLQRTREAVIHDTRFAYLI
jgi:hypothetical protein